MSKLSLPAVDPALVDSQLSWDQDYPAPFVEPCRLREWRALGDAAGLSQFGVSLTILPPAAWPAQRHWHMNEDEFIYVLEGELILITDDDEQVLKAGVVAGLPAGKQDRHHLVNRSDRIAKPAAPQPEAAIDPLRPHDPGFQFSGFRTFLTTPEAE